MFPLLMSEVVIVIERINVTDLVVVVALSAALIIAIYSNLNELSMSIASGLLGYYWWCRKAPC